MSVQIYTSDNLSIVAGKGSYLAMPIDPKNIENQLPEETEHLIRLHISILINGKMKNIFQQYVVDAEEGKLKDYNCLNTLSDILSDLGYKIPGIYSVIEKGISKLYPIEYAEPTPVKD